VLVGIARLASQARTLDTKRRVEYFELPTRTYITRCTSPRVPFEWTINPYRGCEFGCKYCYARYTHEFMELRDGVEFERKIYAKMWNPAAFRAELARIPREHHIAIGTGTDPYQPAERRYKLTRKMLEILAREGGRRLSITTKSDLVPRDGELLARIARANVLHITFTVTTMDAELARLIEPMAPRPDLRIAALAELIPKGIQAGVFTSPILPDLNDSEVSLDAVAAAAARAGAVHFGGNPLFLKPCSEKVFLPFLEERFPQLVERYRERFVQGAFMRGDYPKALQERVRRVRERHGLGRGFVEYKPQDWAGDPQLSLFGEDPSSFTPQSSC
jgi:DNA repair photolyase